MEDRVGWEGPEARSRASTTAAGLTPDKVAGVAAVTYQLQAG